MRDTKILDDATAFLNEHFAGNEAHGIPSFRDSMLEGMPELAADPTVFDRARAFADQCLKALHDGNEPPEFQHYEMDYIRDVADIVSNDVAKEWISNMSELYEATREHPAIRLAARVATLTAKFVALEHKRIVDATAGQ